MKPRPIALPVVLSLGSNLGDRAATLDAAIAEIGALAGVRSVRVSSYLETPALKPHGIDEAAPAYLNAAVALTARVEPHELLQRLREIELAHGRVREERWGDRTLDIDIVAIDGLHFDDETLTVPHPRAHERAFVLAPWLELDPDAVLPGHGRVDELLVTAQGGVA